MNSGGKPPASNIARLLATKSAMSGMNVLLCDTTGQSEKEIKKERKTQSSALPIQNLGENINVIMGATGSSFFTSKNFNGTIKDLTKSFDQIFICTSTRNAYLGLIASLKFSPGLVMIAGLRRTKKSDIKNIKLRQPIDLLFYD